jgi:Xaa-Pro aminopeptidase
MFEQQADKLTGMAGYIAVKHGGYWADLFVTGARRASEIEERAQVALRVLLELAKPGANAGELYAKAMAALTPCSLHPVLSGSVGRRIGLSLNEGSEIRTDSRHVLKAGEVYTLAVGACDPQLGGALMSAMVAITPSGSELLHVSPASKLQ